MNDTALSPIEWKTRIGFAVALFILLTIGTMSLLFLNQTKADEQWVEHTHNVIEHLQTCFLAEREIGTRAREYVLTGQKQYLRHYQADLVGLSQAIEALQELTADNPSQQQRIQTQLRPLINARLSVISSAVTARQRTGERSASAILLQNNALALVDQIRAVVEDMQREERILLHARMAAHARSSQRLFGIILFGWAVAIVFIGAASLQIHRDIVARLQAEDELRGMNRELESFSYSVSHDLRAPLRGIEGFSELILEKYKGRLDQEGQGYFDRICAAARRMGILIDEILNLSRIMRSPFEVKEVDLSVLAREIAEDTQKTSPARKVRWVSPASLPVRGDTSLLRIALTNLLSNAWKFTEKKPEATIELGQMTQAGEKVYYIRDDGAGFDMAYQGKLFQAFQRLHSLKEFPGTGIGLATVQRVIRRHGGRIWAQGAVDHGATFFFTL